MSTSYDSLNIPGYEEILFNPEYQDQGELVLALGRNISLVFAGSLNDCDQESIQKTKQVFSWGLELKRPDDVEQFMNMLTLGPEATLGKLDHMASLSADSDWFTELSNYVSLQMPEKVWELLKHQFKTLLDFCDSGNAMMAGEPKQLLHCLYMWSVFSRVGLEKLVLIMGALLVSSTSRNSAWQLEASNKRVVYTIPKRPTQCPNLIFSENSLYNVLKSVVKTPTPPGTVGYEKLDFVRLLIDLLKDYTQQLLGNQYTVADLLVYFADTESTYKKIIEAMRLMPSSNDGFNIVINSFLEVALKRSELLQEAIQRITAHKDDVTKHCLANSM